MQAGMPKFPNYQLDGFTFLKSAKLGPLEVQEIS